MVAVNVYKPTITNLLKVFAWVARCLFWHADSISLKKVHNTLNGRLVYIYTCHKCDEITVLE